MKTLTKSLLTVVAAVFLLTSCGGGSEVCQCGDLMLSMMKDGKAAKGDEAKMKALEEKYKAKMEACEKLGEGKSEEEKKKMEEEMKACPSYQAAEKMMKEEMGGAGDSH